MTPDRATPRAGLKASLLVIGIVAAAAALFVCWLWVIVSLVLHLALQLLELAAEAGVL